MVDLSRFARWAVLVLSLLVLIPLLFEQPGLKAQAFPKLSGALQRMMSELQSGGPSAAQAYAQTQGVEVRGSDARVVVVIEGSGDLRPLIREQQGLLQAKFQGFWQVELPLGRVSNLAQAAVVSFARLPQVALTPLDALGLPPPRPAAPLAASSASGPIVSEGVSLIGADKLQARGIRGQGVKVAVIDLGFAGLDRIIARGELPSNLTAWNCLGRTDEEEPLGCRRVSPAELSAASLQAFGCPSLDQCSFEAFHGAAVAEIVHDVAPGAELNLFLIRTGVELSLAAQTVVDTGVRVINHSVAWFNEGFYEGRGLVGKVVRDVRQSGVFWVNSAGNFARTHYEGVFTDANGDRLHDTEITLKLQAQQPAIALLTWDNWDRADEDFDFEVRGPDGSKEKSFNPPDGHLLDERLSFLASVEGTYRLRVEWAGDGPAPVNRRLELFVLGSAGLETHPDVAASSLPAPANAAEAFAVGAMGARDWARGKLEPFSSWGPTNDGRAKPDLVAPDCVSTASFENLPTASICGADGLFPGTSAAAPHVAGMVALLLSEDPGRTPQELEGLLKGRAEPVANLTADQAGAGKAQLAALADLEVTSAGADPAEVKPGQTLHVRAVVRNAGPGEAGPFWVGLWRAGEEDRPDRKLVAARVSAGLGSGAQQEVTLAWPVPQDEPTGQEQLVVVADPFADVEEGDETNNRRELSVRVESPNPPPRLEVSPTSLSFSAQEGGDNPGAKTLTVKNAGGEPLSWTASENLGWLKLSRTSGSLGGGESVKVTVTVDVSGLSASNNKGQIVVFASGAKNSPVFVDVSLTVTGGQPSPPTSNVPAGMVEVPAGSFQMGDSFGGEGDSDELPAHNVNVSAFYMDKFEVTKGLWDEVAAWATSHGYDIGPDDGAGKARNHPVQRVSWYEAAKWANARSEKEGLVPVYYTSSSQTTVYRKGKVDVKNEWVKWTANGYRLPTEAEWEKAARGGCERHRFPWCDVDTIQHARANYWSCPGPQCENTSYSFDTSPTRGPHPDYDNDPEPFTSPVGSFGANGYGLFDMAGNVWEWAWDRYDKTYYASSPGVDPRGPASGSSRVRRGGSWFGFAFFVRVANRGFDSPDYESNGLGFRLVRAASSLP